jgi:hypothetical protein
MSKTKSIIQKQKDIENEKKLYPVFNPNANVIANAKTISAPKSPSVTQQASADPDVLIVTSVSKSSRVGKKARHRANTVDPKQEDQSN